MYVNNECSRGSDVLHMWVYMDWCSYGWSKGQQALYPTQQAAYDRLQGFAYGMRPAERDIDRQYLIFEERLGNTSESELHNYIPEEEDFISPFEKISS